ncbi:MAG: antitermination protein NusG [Pirellulales bacterium]|nr:antitermination protein NusG [Pirellulales bacterium]
MPFAELVTNYFPEDLLDGSPPKASLALSVPSDPFPKTRQWWVLHTKHQQEKALARQLLSIGIPFYLPLVSKDHLIRGKRVQSQIPLFGCYLFLYGTDEEYLLAIKTNRVISVLNVPDQWQLLHDLRRLQRLIMSGRPLTIEKRLQVGQKVRVRRGPFANIEGTIIKRRGTSRLLVAVDFLQQGASIAIDDFVVEPIA